MSILYDQRCLDIHWYFRRAALERSHPHSTGIRIQVKRGDNDIKVLLTEKVSLVQWRGASLFDRNVKSELSLPEHASTAQVSVMAELGLRKFVARRGQPILQKEIDDALRGYRD